MLAAGTIVGRRYAVCRLLGRGGMGTVYEVEHVHTGQRLALKVLSHVHELAIERFLREARATAAIRSDHIVRVTDADFDADAKQPFIVMELLEGCDLERATAGGAAVPNEVVDWLRQTARALDKAHRASIVHRDLKPENIFLTTAEDGSPLIKVLDFGLARSTDATAHLTEAGQLLGTPHYMAPEQADPTGPPVTSSTDMFALGLVAFRLLVGRVYWRPGGLRQVLAELLAEPVEAPSRRGSSHGPAFDEWFLRSCHRDPKQRFATIVEQVEALAIAVAPNTVPSIRAGKGSSEQRPPHPESTASHADTLPAALTNFVGRADEVSSSSPLPMPCRHRARPRDRRSKLLCARCVGARPCSSSTTASGSSRPSPTS